MAIQPRLLLILLAAAWLSAATGCSLVLPQTAQRPVIRNPFPQLSRVAVAPFFNQSDEPTLDGREVAIAYYTELQGVRGFEVVPVGVVEEAIIAHRIDLSGPGEARRLAKVLGVDAVVVGSVTEYSPYYPPRIGLRTEWYAANPGFHEIPAGYGLPFGTPEEEFIPDELVYEAEFMAAKAELAAATPDLNASCLPLPELPPSAAPAPEATSGLPGESADPLSLEDADKADSEIVDSTMKAAQARARKPSAIDPFESSELAKLGVKLAQAEEEISAPAADKNSQGDQPAFDAPSLAGPVIAPAGAMPTACASGTIVACPAKGAAADAKAPCQPNFGPVLVHTKIYRGDDADVTQALQGYVFFREDRRIGGWQSYLRRSEDFTRFCCHMHISEMLSARGGSRKAEMVWRWSDGR